MPTPALYINQFQSGLYTQRSPLVTPTVSQGLSTVVGTDALVGGLNMELSNRSTLVRRPGYTRYCSMPLPATEFPLNFHSYRNLSGAINLILDTAKGVYSFTASALASVFTKTTTQQSYFQTVGNRLYWVDGAVAKKWDGTTVSNMGVLAPTAAPTLAFSNGPLSPTTGYKYVYVYRTATTISTASPNSASTLALTDQSITVAGSCSTDPSVTNVDIYRTVDDGTNYYFLTTLPNTGATWSYVDSTPDSGLNNELLAPLNHANDAPPSGASNICYHMGRLWMVVGNYVYFAGGPDTTNGNPEESWPTANVFSYPGAVTALLPTSAGLLVFTHGDSFIIRGTDSSSFYSQPYQANFGVASQNCVAQDGDQLYIYTSRRQLFELSSDLEEIGFAIGDQLLASVDPTKAYLALHRSGTDSGLFLSDGSANVYRYQLSKASWSPKATVIGGVGCIKSLPVTDSDYRLVAGRATGAGYLLYRDLTNFQDDGVNYSPSAAIGQLVIAPLAQSAIVEAVSIERMPVGSPASIGVMLGEIATVFTNLPNPQRRARRTRRPSR